jgi:hypothetical protein
VSFEHDNSKITSVFAFPITLCSHMGHGKFKCFLRYARFFWQRFCTCNNRLACVHKINLKCSLCNNLLQLESMYQIWSSPNVLILVFANHRGNGRAWEEGGPTKTIDILTGEYTLRQLLWLYLNCANAFGHVDYKLYILYLYEFVYFHICIYICIFSMS